MKRIRKLFILCAVACAMFLASAVLAACGDKPETPEETPASVAVDSMEFDLTYPADVAFQMTLGDAKFSKLVYDGADVASANYAWEGASFLIKADYLSGFAVGDYTFSFVTTINTLALKIKVVENPKNPPTDEELMSDPYYTVDQNGKNEVIEPTDENWEKLKAMRTPLGYGESFTESFGNSFYESRLLPYRDDLFSADHSAAGAFFEMTDDDTKKAVRIYGPTDGEYALEQSWEFVAFRGVRFTEGAEYKVDITYTPRTDGSRFQLCFDDAQNVICNLAGQKDQKTTTSGRFVADTANGYNGTISAWLLVSFGGGSSSEVIEINSITVTRLKASPEITGGTFDGEIKDGYIAEGTLTLDYTVSEPTAEGETIRWVASTERDLSQNVTELKTALSGEAGAKSIEIESSLKGLYIGAYVQPNVDPDEYQTVNAPVFVTENKAIGEVEYKTIDLTGTAAQYTEDFETFGQENITFRNMGADSYIKKAPDGMSGNALYVECDGSTQYQGLRFGGYSLKAESVYRVSFKVMFRGAVPDNWTVKFRPGEAYWDDVQVETSLSGKTTDTVYTVELAPMRLGANTEPYELLMHNYMRGCTVIIDDLTIEKVEPVTLAEVGDKATLDFDGNFDMSAADSNPDLKSASTVVSAGKMSGNYLQISSSATDVVGTTLSGFNMTAGKSYRLTMKLILEGEGGLGGQFLVKFMADDGSYVQDMQYTSGIAANTVVNYVTGVITLEEGKNYTSVDVLNYYAAYPMYIDDVAIEVVETPDSLKAETRLENVGDVVSDDFEGNVRTFGCSSVNPFVEKTDDNSGIGASFGKALRIEFNGSSGVYNIASFTNYILKGAGTYRISFDYKVIEADTVHTYATAVVRLDDAAEGYPNVTQGFWVGAVSESVQQFSYDFTLTGTNDNWKFAVSNWAEDVHAVILLDNLRIEKIA